MFFVVFPYIFKGVWIMMKNQRGAIFTLFALLIPLIMAFTGLVVDFGNLYAHYSRLQNAADAAALAGGYVFIQKALFFKCKRNFGG